MTRFLIGVDLLMQTRFWVSVLYFLLAGTAASLGWFATDREPPFEVISNERVIAYAGHTVTLRAKVRREIWRQCSADMSRYVLDPQGDRLDLGQSHFSAKFIEDMEKLYPGELRIQVPIPADFDTGPSVLVSVLQYRCNRAIHSWAPIVVTTMIPFEVRP